MKKYFLINYILFRNAYIRDSKISGFIPANILSQLLDITITIVFFQAIFSNTKEIAGWSFYQVLFLYAFIKAVSTLHGAWTKKGINSLSNELIRLGDLDFYLTKPVNSMFFVSISKPRLYALIALSYEIGLMIYAAANSGFVISAISIIWFAVLACFSIILFYYLKLILTIPVFWLIRLFSLTSLMDRMVQFARYPTGIFPRFLRIGLLTLFPVLLISFFPVKTLFYGPDTAYIVYMVFMTVIFHFITKYFWQAGVKRYGSASS